ncbi:MAG: SCP2 sterol-binding domain-containing protein [Pseudomonadota bacterium]
MLIRQTVTSVLEIALNQILALASENDELLSPLEDSVCIIHVQELGMTFGLHFSKDKVEITSQDMPTDKEKEQMENNVCFLTISLSALPELQKTSQITTLIKQGKLDFYGDLSVLQRVSKVFSALDIDIGELLSQYIGDAPSHWVMTSAEKLRIHLQRQLNAQAITVADFILDERPIAVRGIMVTNYIDEVKALRSDVARFEARIKLLEESR